MGSFNGSYLNNNKEAQNTLHTSVIYTFFNTLSQKSDISVNIS